MKYIYKLSLLLFIIGFSSCELDLINENAATEEQALNTKDGLLATAKGMNQLYATSALGAMINYTSVTAHESSAMTTFSSLEELQDGGPQLSGENERVTRLFSSEMRVKGIAESILNNVSNVDMDEGTRSGLIGMASMFKALSIGDMASTWTHVALDNGTPEASAAFVSREDALTEAVSLLENAIATITTNPISSEFTSALGTNIDVLNCVHALASRYSLYLGNNDKAIAHATHTIDGFATPSMFNYDDQNSNPVYLGYFDGTVQYAPVSNFGLAETFTIDAADQRSEFFMIDIEAVSLTGTSVDSLNASFYTGQTNGIPVFRLAEMMLNQAEAYARKSDMDKAESLINSILSKTGDSDAFGIGAGLSGDFSAGGDATVLMNEIYKNRRIELFLSGSALEDSRRFNRPEPPTTVDYNAERNRNYYPFPYNERLNNENTPADPEI